MIWPSVRGAFLLFALGLTATFSGACGPPALGDLQVSARANAYTISVDLSGPSGSREDAWSVSGDRVWVDWTGTALEEGSVSLELTSPDGIRAYRESAMVGSPPGGAASAVSSPGSWTVRFFWSGATGPLQVELAGVQ